MCSHFIYLPNIFLLLKSFLFFGFHFHLLPFDAMQYEHAIKITLSKSTKYKLSLTDSGHKTILQTHKKSQLQRCICVRGEIVSQKTVVIFFSSSWKSKKNTTLLLQKKKCETVMNNIIINKNYKFVVVNIS